MFDIVAGSLALAALWPVILFVALSVYWQLGRPVLYVEWRPGLHARSFKIFKFRTMTNDRSPDGELMPDSQRITNFGRRLRASSLDELPELWNVLRGDMSLVGPRPLLTEYLEYYSEEEARRHDVRPGITGWAQVNGRNAITWEEKFALDVWYVDNQSLALDIKILFMTIVKVLRREGVAHPGQATMPKFKGKSQ